MAITEQAIAAVQEPTWQTVEVDKGAEVNKDDVNIIMTIVYKRAPDSYATVEADTRVLIRSVLSEIKKAGIALPGPLILIEVFTQENVFGETGTPLFRNFGWASYNSVSDVIEFKRP